MNLGLFLLDSNELIGLNNELLSLLSLLISLLLFIISLALFLFILVNIHIAYDLLILLLSYGEYNNICNCLMLKGLNHSGVRL